MSYELIPTKGVPIKAWIRGVVLEDAARAQLHNIASMSFVQPHTAVMPDAHNGRGATVGSVIPTIGAIMPAAAGVDLGCGVIAWLTTLVATDLPDSLGELRSAIETGVPHGRTDNGGKADQGAWVSPPEHYVTAAKGLLERLNPIIAKHPKLDRPAKRAINHLGTLGTGNHFIEVCLDEASRVWVMLHSGSRGIGNAIGQYFITKAQEEMARDGIILADPDLSYLRQNTESFNDYLEALQWAQDYALLNRALMMEAVLEAIRAIIPKPFTTLEAAIQCHHNYVAQEEHFGETVWLTRKGAVSARLGELGIIPGSMGDKSYIVRGKGNLDSFCSCSHGAGRAMSRNQARKTFTLADHVRDTAGIECRKDASVIDETPKAYKPIDAVMAAQEDLIEVVHTLRQVVCVKG